MRDERLLWITCFASLLDLIGVPVGIDHGCAGESSSSSEPGSWLSRGSAAPAPPPRASHRIRRHRCGRGRGGERVPAPERAP